jgi:hypothetical protein
MSRFSRATNGRGFTTSVAHSNSSVTDFITGLASQWMVYVSVALLAM